jgi:hypothetical protein
VSRLGERQAERLQPVVGLVEQQKLGVVADHAVVLRDNPELNLDTHAHLASGYVRGASLSTSAFAGHPLPTLLHALVGEAIAAVEAVLARQARQARRRPTAPILPKRRRYRRIDPRQLDLFLPVADRQYIVISGCRSHQGR